MCEAMLDCVGLSSELQCIRYMVTLWDRLLLWCLLTSSVIEQINHPHFSMKSYCTFYLSGEVAEKSLKNVCSPWLQFTDILSPILLLTTQGDFFLQLMLMQRESEYLSFFPCALSLMCDHLSLHPERQLEIRLLNDDVCC